MLGEPERGIAQLQVDLRALADDGGAGRELQAQPAVLALDHQQPAAADRLRAADVRVILGGPGRTLEELQLEARVGV